MRMMVPACLLVASAAVAQPPPDRNANVYNGTAHEPAGGPTTNAEHNAGVAPPPGQAQQENQEVDALGRKLLKQEGQAPR